MILSVALSKPFLVLPTAGEQVDRQHDEDAPPPYPTSYPASRASSSLSLPPASNMNTPALVSRSGPTEQQSVKANITLQVPSGSACTNLISLTARLVGSESLSYNRGQFEQSWPIDINVRVPIPERFVLQAGSTYRFEAIVPCPPNMPPSVQLCYGRMKYKLRVRAKIRSAKSVMSRSLLPPKTLTVEEPVLVMQATQIETDAFSKIRFIAIEGLGSTCISLPPSPLLLGESATVSLSLPDAEAKSRTRKVEVKVIQDVRMRLRSASSSSSSRLQTRPSIHSRLGQMSPSDLSKQSVSKAYEAATRSNTLDTHFNTPTNTELQPTTRPGSDAVILLSHRLVLTITYNGACGVNKDQPETFMCSWPTEVAYSEAVSGPVVDELPRYTKLDASPKASPDSVHMVETPCL